MTTKEYDEVYDRVSNRLAEERKMKANSNLPLFFFATNSIYCCCGQVCYCEDTVTVSKGYVVVYCVNYSCSEFQISKRLILPAITNYTVLSGDG